MQAFLPVAGNQTPPPPGSDLRSCFTKTMPHICTHLGAISTPRLGLQQASFMSQIQLKSPQCSQIPA